jgi:hypothetical protein
LAEFVPDLRVHEFAFGTGYFALGHYRPRDERPLAATLFPADRRDN